MQSDNSEELTAVERDNVIKEFGGIIAMIELNDT